MSFDLFRYEGRVPSMHTEAASYGSFTYPVAGELIFGCGVLFQPLALWLGAHYSRHNRRWCINLLPCLTVWVALPGGKTP